MSEGGGHPLRELTIVRLRELLREPEVIFWVFAFPILMALALGIAFRSRPVDRVPVGIGDGPDADRVLAALRASGEVAPRRLGATEIDTALRNGDVHLVVLPGNPPTYRYDPTRPESRLARLVADDALQRAAGRSDVWRAQDERVIEAGSRYIDWLIPGLLGMNIMGTGMWGIGFSVVQARTRKLLKRLVATPMRRRDYLLSHVLGRVMFLALEVGALVGFGWLAFGVPVRGSLATLAAVALAGALCFAAIGLLVASRARTIEMVSGLMNVVMLPMWIFSGVFFSSRNFPDVLQPFIQALPLTALNDALRAVMIEGAGLAGVSGEAGILGVWGGGCFLAALRLFRWR